MNTRDRSFLLTGTRRSLLFSASLCLALFVGATRDDVVLARESREPGPPASVRAPVPARFVGRDPGLAPAAGGGLHVTYVRGDGDDARVLYRHLAADGTLAEPVFVSPAGAAIHARGEVPPRVVTLGRSHGASEAESLAIVYPVRMPGKWKGELWLQRSVDSGRTWTEPTTLHDDGVDGRPAGGSHGFVDAVALDDGAAAFVWLDNRDGAQGLRSARVEADGRVARNVTVDSVTCQCCATAVLASGGTVTVAYRDLESGVRDISLARSSDGGRSFGAPRPVSEDGWRIDGCPHTGPRLTEDGAGALWATWFTGRDPGIYAARLGPASFGDVDVGPRRAVALMSDAPRRFVAHPEIGRLPDGRVAVVYEATRDGSSTLEMRQISPAGEIGPPMTLADEGAFPRLLAREGRSWLSYTAVTGDGSTEVVIVALESLLGTSRRPR